MSDIENLIDRKFVKGTASEVSGIRCPVCGGPLRATFSEVGGKMSLGIQCRKFCYRSNIDGLDSAPPWVKELGERFETV
jgi:ssDNA-binding Zn-finger/Zn-ribbon topoisomerase 1